MLPAFKRTPVSLIELLSHNSLTDLLTDLVQQGISEKVALATNALASFITGFALAYSASWRLALALSAILPCIGITGAVMNKVITGYTQYINLQLCVFIV